jgi:hypothetical protein
MKRALALVLRGSAFVWLASCNVAQEDQRMAGGGIETGNTGALSGRVVDEAGYPMQQAEVDVVGMAFSPSGPSGGVVRADTTDSLGNYRFRDLPQGSYSLYSPGYGETMRAAMLTRLRLGDAPVRLQDMIARPTVVLAGRLFAASGVDARSLTACIPGANRCVHPEADNTYRFEDAPKGPYELVFLSGQSAHYLALEVSPSASGIVYVKDVVLGDSADADRIPYRFYPSTLARSYSILPVEYPAGLEPAWYRDKSFASVSYFLLNDGQAVPALSVDYFSQWKYRETLDAAALGGVPELDGPLPGFPLPVRLTSADFDFSQALPDGSDLVVSDGAGHLLAHEIERWDAQNGKAEIWVRLDSLAAGAADRAITLHWGRGESVKRAGGAGVFRGENDFIGAWHLNDRAPDRVVAEARGLYPGTLGCLDAGDDPAKVRSGEAVVAGGYRNGQLFTCVDVRHQTGLDVSSEFSLLAWGKSYHHDATHDQVLASKWDKNKREWAFTLLSDETLEIKFGDATGWTLGSVRTVDPVVNPDKWHHYGVVFDQGAVRIFIDGKEARTHVQSGVVPDAVNRNGSDFYIGSDTMDKYTNWEGDLDEVEYFSAAKSGAWVQAAWLTQKQ